MWIRTGCIGWWWPGIEGQFAWGLGEIIEEMALPKRCVNNEIALKKINFRIWTSTRKFIFTMGLRRRGWSAQMLHSVPSVYSTATSRPQTLTSRRRSFSRMNLDSEPKKKTN
ncbi:uncharacterized protein LOC120422060 [Culex pipiens pallens]|uniref:uncharacterized protein LOC120422060 n=1 Tax=Culex pipiens pallens TaxID=42434 RepID=UPI0022AA7719|nr:uncharacterized protein LOC120422060 [Culex pipiens pallens]